MIANASAVDHAGAFTIEELRLGFFKLFAGAEGISSYSFEGLEFIVAGSST